jgi:hypothetical protein
MSSALYNLHENTQLVSHGPWCPLGASLAVLTSSKPPSSEMAQSKTSIPPIQKTMRKLEQGHYTATDVRWGMALDLSGADNRSLIAYGFHGLENQQARAFGSSRLQEELIVAEIRCSTPLQPRVHVHCTVVGVPSLRCRFRHLQRQERRWLVSRYSGLEGTASRRKRGSRHGGLPDVLGIGGHG